MCLVERRKLFILLVLGATVVPVTSNLAFAQPYSSFEGCGLRYELVACGDDYIPISHPYVRTDWFRIKVTNISSDLGDYKDHCCTFITGKYVDAWGDLPYLGKGKWGKDFNGGEVWVKIKIGKGILVEGRKGMIPIGGCQFLDDNYIVDAEYPYVDLGGLVAKDSKTFRVETTYHCSGKAYIPTFPTGETSWRHTVGQEVVNTPNKNRAPTAYDQEVTTEVDTPVQITLVATDPDCDELIYEVGTSSANNGTLTGIPPNMTYTPDPGFTGTDSFLFMVFDKKTESNVATVFITVVAQVLTTAYVDDDATGTNSGESWENALNDLQDALLSGASNILVAQGVYRPAEVGNLNATFLLRSGVELYGGYAGVSADDPDARDVESYETILSGDLAGDDYVSFPYYFNEGNSYHVVTSSGTDETGVLDGFTIMRGNAMEAGTDSGAGMYNSLGNPTVRNCTFTHNLSHGKGGGMYNDQSDPTVANCTFKHNVARRGGGGMCNSLSDPQVINCIFNESIADCSGGGGGMCNYQSSPTVSNCTFINNNRSMITSRDGGGIWNDSGNPTVTDCTFSGNAGGRSGGGMYNDSGSPTVTNCEFNGNYAREVGGGFCSFGGNPTITNCAFVQNGAIFLGGGMYINFGNPTVDTCLFQDNWSGGLGSGIFRDGLGTVINCTFINNDDY